MPRSNRPLRYTQQYQINPNYTRGKYFYEKFGAANPSLLTVASSITALPTASAGQVDQMHTPGGYYAEVYQTTAQTLQPIGNAKGLVLDGDQVDNESIEIVPGANAATSPYAFTVGTDSDFFFRATINIVDASGSDQLLIGFRKAEAFAVPTSFLTTGDAGYTDFYGIGFAATKANPNPVNVAYDIGDTGSTTVQAAGFTWADNKVHTLEVRVIGGKAHSFINGNRLGNLVSVDGSGGIYGAGAAITAQQTVTGPSVTFTAATVVVPFIFVRHDADVLSGCYLQEWEGGHLVDVGLDPNQE